MLGTRPFNARGRGCTLAHNSLRGAGKPTIGSTRIFKQAPMTRELPSGAGQPHRRPERGRHAGYDGDAVPSLERLRDPERAQAPARDEQPFGVARVLANPGAEVEDVLLADPARSPEIRDSEALDRPHRKTFLGQE